MLDEIELEFIWSEDIQVTSSQKEIIEILKSGPRRLLQINETSSHTTMHSLYYDLGVLCAAYYIKASHGKNKMYCLYTDKMVDPRDKYKINSGIGKKIMDAIRKTPMNRKQLYEHFSDISQDSLRACMSKLVGNVEKYEKMVNLSKDGYYTLR